MPGLIRKDELELSAVSGERHQAGKLRVERRLIVQTRGQRGGVLSAQQGGGRERSLDRSVGAGESNRERISRRGAGRRGRGDEETSQVSADRARHPAAEDDIDTRGRRGGRRARGSGGSSRALKVRGLVLKKFLSRPAGQRRSPQKLLVDLIGDGLGQAVDLIKVARQEGVSRLEDCAEAALPGAETAGDVVTTRVEDLDLLVAQSHGERKRRGPNDKRLAAGAEQSERSVELGESAKSDQAREFSEHLGESSFGGEIRSAQGAALPLDAQLGCFPDQNIDAPDDRRGIRIEIRALLGELAVRGAKGRGQSVGSADHRPAQVEIFGQNRQRRDRREELVDVFANAAAAAEPKDRLDLLENLTGLFIE